MKDNIPIFLLALFSASLLGSKFFYVGAFGIGFTIGWIAKYLMNKK